MLNLEIQKKVRKDVQDRGAKFVKDNKFSIICLPTGAGKGKLCMMALDSIKSSKKWLVVVPELIQIENLRGDIEKHGFHHLLDEKIYDIVCYASLKKFKKKPLNVWFNEAHRLSLLREDIASVIDYDRIIADSATIPIAVRERLSNLGEFKEFSMTFSEAVESGLLPEPKIQVIYTKLDSIIPRNKVLRNKREYHYTDQECYNYLEEQMEYWRKRSWEDPGPWTSIKMNQLGSQRKKFLAERKTEQARLILKSLGAKRTLCYAGSVEQSNELGGKLAINSKKGKKHNLKVLEQFNNYEIDRIYMNKMGKEGLNLEGIRAVVLVQLSSGKDEGLEVIQKIGRSLRSGSPEVYILVCKKTIDEVYLKRAVETIDKSKKIEYSEFGDIYTF